MSEFRPREPRLSTKRVFFFAATKGVATKRFFFSATNELPQNQFFLLPRNEFPRKGFYTRHKMNCRETSFQPATKLFFLNSPRNELPRNEFKIRGRRTLGRDSPEILICQRKNYMRVCVTPKDYSKLYTQNLQTTAAIWSSGSN